MEDLIAVLSRWVHVGTAIVIVGGSVFMRFVLMPAAAQLPAAEHDALRERTLKIWKKFVSVGIGLFLISGIYNYVLAFGQHPGDRLYHGLMGMKILIALVVFFLASALAGRGESLNGLRRNRKLWLSVVVLLAAVVVAIAGVLKVAVKPSHRSTERHRGRSLQPMLAESVIKAVIRRPDH